MKALLPSIGNWVSGEDRFWDREEEMSRFIQMIDSGANILLTAQRRMGKTSLMREAARKLESKYHSLIIDIQGAESPEDVIADLAKETKPLTSILSKTLELFKGVGENVEELGASELRIKFRSNMTAGDWMIKGERLFDILANADKPVILMMDEVPIFVQRLLIGGDSKITSDGRAKTDLFMSWLRSNSQRHQGKVMMVLTGSIGLEPILNQAGLSSTINHLRSFKLPPWNKETSVGCVDAIAHSHKISLETGVSELIYEKLGLGIPHYVQKFYEDCREEACSHNGESISKKDVANAYKTRLLSAIGSADLSHYEERIKLALGTELAPMAFDILTEAAIVGNISMKTLNRLKRIHRIESMPFSDAIRLILRTLEHDGYLEEREDGYVFVFPLLKDWWNKRYRYDYTTILERGA